MKKFLRRFFSILGIALVLIIGLSAAAAAIFNRQIGGRIVQEINQQLLTELSVEEIDLSFFRNFPNASAVLKNVQLKDTQEGLLLEAQTISFKLGLFSLLRSNIQLESATISKGAITLRINEQGQANYQIYRTTQNSDTRDSVKEKSNIRVSLQETRLQDMELIYADELTEQYYNIILDRADFSGAFAQSQFNLLSNAEITSRFVDIGAVRHLPGTKLSYQADIQINLAESIYQFEQLDVQLGDNVFKVDGAIEQRDNAPYFDLFVTSEEGNIQGVFQLLPQEYLSLLGDFTSKGDFNFEALIKGAQAQNLNPEVSAKLSLTDGRISSPRLNNDMKDVSFQADYTNGKFRDNGSSRLVIQDFSGYFNRELIEMEMRLENFDAPEIDFQLDGALPLSTVYGLLNNPGITAGSGEIEIKNLNLNGSYADMIRPSRIANVRSSGVLEFDDASLTLNREKLILDRGTLELKDNQLLLKGLKLEGAGSELLLSGQAFNLVPVLFADSLNSQNAELEFEAELTGDQLDIDRLLTATDLQIDKRDTSNVAETVVDSIRSAQVKKRKQLTRFLNGTFRTSIEEYNYGDIEGSDFTGILSFNNNIMNIRGGTNAMGGQVQLDGEMVFEAYPRLEARISTEAIDIKTFFAQTNNFGQEVLTQQHISGSLNSNILIYAYWSEQGALLDDQLNVLAEVDINEGELKDFKILEAFSTFVKVKELKNIKFRDLKNYLEFRRKNLYIPAMFIQSNALNLTISGQHNFANEFDYYLKVNAGQVLTERFKKYDPSLDPVKARRNGFFNLHYNIYGHLEDYSFKTAKRQVKAEFERSQIRKKEIQLSLNEAFVNARLLEEPVEWQDAEANNQ